MKKLLFAVAAIAAVACAKESTKPSSIKSSSQSYILSEDNDSAGVVVDVLANADIELHLDASTLCSGAGVLATAHIGNDTLLNLNVVEFPFDTIIKANASGELDLNTEIQFISPLDSILCTTLGEVEVLLDVKL